MRQEAALEMMDLEASRRFVRCGENGSRVSGFEAIFRLFVLTQSGFVQRQGPPDFFAWFRDACGLSEIPLQGARHLSGTRAGSSLRETAPGMAEFWRIGSTSPDMCCIAALCR